MQAPDTFGRTRELFGEHALRVAGAQALAAAGVETVVIQVFARWGSAAVLRYIQETPLVSQVALAEKTVLAAPCLPGGGRKGAPP